MNSPLHSFTPNPVGACPSGPALVSDRSATRLAATRFDPSRDLTPQQAMQCKLLWLARKASEAAAAVDARGDVWHTREGMALVNAIHDATEKDELYDWLGDLAFEFGDTLDEVRQPTTVGLGCVA